MEPLLIEILKVYGIKVNEQTDVFAFFLCIILILTSIVLLCVLNLSLYICSLYVLYNDSA